MITCRLQKCFKIIEKKSEIRNITDKDLHDNFSFKMLSGLMLHHDDKELLLGASETQGNKVHVQGKHFLRSLEIDSRDCIGNKSIMWKFAF